MTPSPGLAIMSASSLPTSPPVPSTANSVVMTTLSSTHNLLLIFSFIYSNFLRIRSVGMVCSSLLILTHLMLHLVRLSRKSLLVLTALTCHSCFFFTTYNLDFKPNILSPFSFLVPDCSNCSYHLIQRMALSY